MVTFSSSIVLIICLPKQLSKYLHTSSTEIKGIGGEIGAGGGLHFENGAEPPHIIVLPIIPGITLKAHAIIAKI